MTAPLSYLLAVLMMLAAVFGALPAVAHEGHDHGAPPPPVSVTIAPRADASSADFELVAIARGAKLRIYVDTFRGNEPVQGADIEVDGPGGTNKATAMPDGAYTLDAPWLARPGRYDLAFTVQTGDAIDILTATLTVPEPPAPPIPTVSLWNALIGSAWAQDIQARFATRDTSLWAVGGGAFVAGLVVAALFRRRSRAAITAILAALVVISATPSDADSPSAAAPLMAERDIAQRFADGAIFVPKTTQRILAIRTLFTEERSFTGTVELPARIIPDPSAAGFVQASVAGRLMPPPGGFPRLGTRVEAGDVLALVQPAIGAADVTSQQQQSRELDQQIAIIERRLERFRQIQSVIARAQIEDAELELRGLRTRRANLERAPREPERLVAPVSGVIATVQAVAGQIAEPNAIIFQIVDPSRFWVEALSFEAHAINGSANGRFGDGRTVTLAYRGSGLADRNQAIPIQFSVEGAARGLRAGQLLTVLASTTDERTGIAVPRTSVLRGPNGQSIVYEHTNAERFLPREVRVEPLDGTRVLIVSGVEAGKRIVTQGAELLNQIR
ncbi:HlyD family efflux transporter periplasmic adaptor subunit [Phreatobacter sp.]|uniref:efflux RND transporter periplasmic adaptor subunit n=1 Tax=Phreatobacter sp. TaxID=1966341 RepID=UPI0025E4DF32|nr:HlyD family efflux transporter periplasmic adaptor subunit [Phreatobacter sp.]